MYIDVRYDGKIIISRKDNTWWITGFNPNYLGVTADSLKDSFSIRFNDIGMYNAFQAAHNDVWKFGLMQGFGIATYSF